MSVSAAQSLPDDHRFRIELESEYRRIELLFDILARHREGLKASSDHRTSLDAAQHSVGELRDKGLWLEITGQSFSPLACDILAAALFAAVWQSRAFKLQALQPGISEFGLSQALLHEALMVTYEEELDLIGHLSPASDLISGNWVQVEGNGAARTVRAGPRLLRRILGEDAFGALPAGISLCDNGSAPIPDLILQPKTASELREVTALARYSVKNSSGHAVVRGGPAILLTGPPGTGKSLAARHIARDIERPLFQLNLGEIVSKWLGQTERNLSRVFEQMAGTRGAMLIDECDAILGRRVSVKEGRDHWVNLTVSHLLMLLERHQGPVILTSNLRTNLDDAYLRRFAAVVDFRRPDAALRQRIWLRELEPFLTQTKREEIAALAASVDLSAAEIANACFFAAALADAKGVQIDAAHVARAVQAERTKSTATFAPSDLNALSAFLPGGLS